MDALLLIIVGGLNTTSPTVELKPFDTFEACYAEAVKEGANGHYAQCSAEGAAWKYYPSPPPLRMYKWLRVEPKQAKLSETFTFHRPIMDSCQAEAHELRKQGHKAKCSHTGIGEIAPAQPKQN